MKNKLNAWTEFLLLFVTIICILAGCESGSGSDKSYKITIASGGEYVDDCPKSAKAGQAVKFRTLFVTDADLYVSVDGDENFGGYNEDGLYEFVMPDHDVEIDVWIVSNGLAQGDSSDAVGETSDNEGWSQDEYDDDDDDDEDEADEDEEEETSSPKKITGGGRLLPASPGPTKKTEATTSKKKKAASATTAVDPDDHDIDAYYEDNKDIYDSYEDAWEGFEDDKDAWDDY